jgi:magnesium transporter
MFFLPSLRENLLRKETTMTARRRLMRRRIHKVGFSPGSLVYVGSPRTERVKIHLTAYNNEHFWESDLEHPEACGVSLHAGLIKWIHVSGLHEVEVIEKIGRCFDLHPLLLEDVLNTGQRPKVEDYDNCLFIVLKVSKVSHTLPSDS